MVKPLRTTLVCLLGLLVAYTVSYWYLVKQHRLHQYGGWAVLGGFSAENTQRFSRVVNVIYTPAQNLDDTWRFHQLKKHLRGTWVSSDGKTTLTLNADDAVHLSMAGKDGTPSRHTMEYLWLHPRSGTLLVRRASPLAARSPSGMVPVYTLDQLADGALRVEATHVISDVIVSGRGLPTYTLRRAPAPAPPP